MSGSSFYNISDIDGWVLQTPNVLNNDLEMFVPLGGDVLGLMALLFVDPTFIIKDH